MLVLMNGLVLRHSYLWQHFELNTDSTLKQVLEKNYILEELTRGDNFHNMKNIHRYFVFVH